MRNLIEREEEKDTNQTISILKVVDMNENNI